MCHHPSEIIMLWWPDSAVSLPHCRRRRTSTTPSSRWHVMCTSHAECESERVELCGAQTMRTTHIDASHHRWTLRNPIIYVCMCVCVCSVFCEMMCKSSVRSRFELIIHPETNTFVSSIRVELFDIFVSDFVTLLFLVQ